MKIAYVCSLFPAISHTFVLREIQALRDRDVQVDTFSIHRASPENLLSRADREAFESTYTILPPRWGALAAAHWRIARRAPRTYLQMIAAALQLTPESPRGALWQLFYLTEAVVLWSECSRRGIRHVHAHMGNVGADAAMLAARLGSASEPSAPWSWSLTLHGPDELFEVARFRLAEKVASASFVVCISDFTRSQLMALSPIEDWEKLHVVHVGIPVEQFTRRNRREPDDPVPTVLFVGRHVPQKGQATLLDAISLLAEEGREVRLILAGDGPTRCNLEELAVRMGIAERVSFPGAVGQEEIARLYEQASIFCVPSFAEGLPTVLMEAMAMELPVVSTRITGIPELVVDGVTGLLVNPARPDQMAAAIARLSNDPDTARCLAAAGRAAVLRDFDTRQSAARLHDLLGHHLGGTQP